MEHKKQPLVSILIPMYNSEVYISETIESCLKQNYKNIEIIIVDDGSDDNSVSIVEEYLKKYSFIRLFIQKNGGAPKARNLAFKKSSGRYIQYLDADDLLSKDKIENQIELLMKESFEVISFTDFIRFSGDIFFPAKSRLPELNDFNDSIDFFNYLLKTGWLQTSCWLISRKLVDVVGDWREDLTRNQDGDFFGRVILNSRKGIYSKTGRVLYRVLNPNSITKKKKDIIYFESYLRSFYISADLIIDKGNKHQMYPIAKVINGFTEKLFLLNSKEIKSGYQKIKDLGFSDIEILQNPIVKYLKYFVGYKFSIRIKFFILKLVNTRLD